LIRGRATVIVGLTSHIPARIDREPIDEFAFRPRAGLCPNQNLGGGHKLAVAGTATFVSPFTLSGGTLSVGIPPALVYDSGARLAIELEGTVRGTQALVGAAGMCAVVRRRRAFNTRRA
jgi:hypothetical protein